jgi:hypothetical protein
MVPILSAGQSFDISVPVPANGNKTPGPFGDMLQIAVKHSGGVFYFSDMVPLEVFLTDGGLLEGGVYLQNWGAIPEQVCRWKTNLFWLTERFSPPPPLPDGACCGP